MLGAGLWTREYAHALAVVNPTDTPLRIALPERFSTGSIDLFPHANHTPAVAGVLELPGLNATVLLLQ